MEQETDISPTQKKEPALVAVLNSQEKEEEKPESAKTTVVLRAFGLNLDIVVLFATLFIFGLIGYSVARINGMTSADIAQEISEYVWLFCYVVLGIGGAFLKLIMNKGVWAEKLHQGLIDFLARTFKPRDQIDPMTYRAQNSIVGDRKIYREKR